MRALGRIREAGQAGVEAALVVPLFIIMSFAICEFGWYVFYSTTLSNAIEGAQYSVTTSEKAAYHDDAKLVHDKIVEGDQLLNAGDLQVTNATISTQNVSKPVTGITYGDSGRESRDFGLMRQSTDEVTVKADVAYTPPKLFGVLPQPTLTHKVDSTALSDTIFELG